MLAPVSKLGVETYSLGSARPALDLSRPLRPQHEELAEAELDLLQRVANDVRPAHIVHLYSDPILRWIVRTPAFRSRVSLCLFFMRWHYPSAYENALNAFEFASAQFQRFLLHRWSKRPDASATFFLDPILTRIYSRSSIAAVWFPEPPVSELPESPKSRRGAVLYGALAARKGVDLLAQAAPWCPGLDLTLAGYIEPGYESRLHKLIHEIKSTGATVRLRAPLADEHEGLSELAAARCAVLPYPRHFGMSRVLLEACAVGTPVVVHDFGMLGHLVKKHGLGIAVDCRNPSAFGAALRAMSAESRPDDEMLIRLQSFAKRYSTEKFETALRRALDDDAEAPQSRYAGGAA
jgi:glycosyltransferase involved in cell wall biosynthesis